MSVNPAAAQHAPIMESRITCPECGVSKIEVMPTDACQFYYDCASCGTLLRPRPGDCCVFCSYGSQRCPPQQDASCADTSACEGSSHF